MQYQDDLFIFFFALLTYKYGIPEGGLSKHDFFPIFFSVRSRNINFHGIGDRHARNDGEKLRGKHLNRSSHPTSFVYIPTNALSIRQFASKM